MKSESVGMTAEDCLNITKWWTAASIAVEAGVRTRFSDSEYATMSKITKAKETLNQ